MYFHVYLIYRFTRTFTDHSSVITRCWGFELQNGKSSLKSPQTLATQDFAPASFLSTPDSENPRNHKGCGGFVLLSESGTGTLLVHDLVKRNPQALADLKAPGPGDFRGLVLFGPLPRPNRRHESPGAAGAQRGYRLALTHDNRVGPFCGSGTVFALRPSGPPMLPAKSPFDRSRGAQKLPAQAMRST